MRCRTPQSDGVGVKLPCNASKERSATHAELAHRAARLDKAAAKIVALHQAQDEHGEPRDAQRQARIDELRREARTTREFIASRPKRVNRKGAELKTNVTDPDSAKMATGKGATRRRPRWTAHTRSSSRPT